MNTDEKPETATNNMGEAENVPVLQNNTLPTDEPDEKGSYKLTDVQFIAELELNNGLYTQTALSIQKHYGISYTRQAVYQRAVRFYLNRQQMEEAITDQAKEVLYKAIAQDTDEKKQLKAAMFHLTKTGYGKY